MVRRVVLGLPSEVPGIEYDAARTLFHRPRPDSETDANQDAETYLI